MKKYYVSGEYLNKALLDDIQVNLVLAFNDKTICVTFYR